MNNILQNRRTNITKILFINLVKLMNEYFYEIKKMRAITFFFN